MESTFLSLLLLVLGSASLTGWENLLQVVEEGLVFWPQPSCFTVLAFSFFTFFFFFFFKFKEGSCLFKYIKPDFSPPLSSALSIFHFCWSNPICIQGCSMVFQLKKPFSCFLYPPDTTAFLFSLHSKAPWKNHLGSLSEIPLLCF